MNIGRQLWLLVLTPLVGVFPTGCGDPDQNDAVEGTVDVTATNAAELALNPSVFTLDGRWSSQSLALVAKADDGAGRDLSHDTRWVSLDPEIAEVSADGVVFPRLNGRARIQALVGEHRLIASATVTNVTDNRVSFAYHVEPMLRQLGCNAAQCHGAKGGQGGFSLSLFGGDPARDHAELTREGGGRRVNLVEPGKSLVLRKATGMVPHHGAMRVKPGSAGHQVLLIWICQGAPFGGDEPALTRLDLSERELRMRSGESRRLLARAVFADSSEHDATWRTTFDVADPDVAKVDADGTVTAVGVGETAIIASFNRKTAVARVVVPQSLVGAFPEMPARNRIDELVLARLRLLGIPPSENASDNEFLRRVYLDVTGRIPMPDEVFDFVGDQRPDRRSRLIDKLLDSEAHHDFLAMKWGDLLRIKSEYPVNLWPKGAMTYHRWVRASVAANKPYDRFVRELLTTTGSNFRDAPVNFFRAVPDRTAESVAETAALLFMGARMACARCHVHPDEGWTLRDHHGLAAFFSQVRYKATKEWKEEIVFLDRAGELKDPITGDAVVPMYPDGTVATLAPGADRRAAFADWLIRPGNRWFARNAVNRIWYWLFGRGIVHPPDDLRPTNPPPNPELFEYLTVEFVRSGYDVRNLYRLILNSGTYQLSSRPLPGNRHDAANFSHYPARRLGAEQLVDAVCQVTGVPESYSSQIPEPYTFMPAGCRAVQLPDANLKTAVLELFGSPPRDTPYEAERSDEVSMRQALYFLNSDHLENKIENSPVLARLAKTMKDDKLLTSQLYLTILSRSPTESEARFGVNHFEKSADDRVGAARDLAWALINSREFLFNR